MGLLCIREVKYLIWDHLEIQYPYAFHNFGSSSALNALYFDKCRKYTHLESHMFFQLKRYANGFLLFIFLYNIPSSTFWLSIILLTVRSQRMEEFPRRNNMPQQVRAKLLRWIEHFNSLHEHTAVAGAWGVWLKEVRLSSWSCKET